MILARCPECSTTFRVRPEQLRARQGRVRCGQCNHAFNALETLVEEGTAAHPQLQPPASGPALFVLEEKPADVTGPAERIDPYDTWPPAEPAPGDDPAALPALTEAEPEPEPYGSMEPVIEFGADFLPDEARPREPADAGIDITAAVEALLPDDDEATPEAPPTLTAIDDDGRREPVGTIIGDTGEEWSALEADMPDEASTPTGLAKEAADAARPGDAFPDESVPGFDDIPTFEPSRPEEDSPPAFDAAPLPDRLPIPDSLSLDLDTLYDEPADGGRINSTAGASALEFGLPPEAEPPEAPIDFETLIHTRDPGHAGEALAQADAAAGHTTPVTPAPVITPPPVADAADDEDDDADTEEVEAPRSPALSQALWAAAATLLTLGILAQGALVFRNEIALSSPQLRPALESLCAGLGCDLPLPRHAADIAIESSDIQPDASREAYFTLHATLRNRAEFQQTWPHVEITLTDARDKALVRRVLEPAQWLPADAPRDAFPARGEAAIRVAFEAPGVAAAGYRVYAFYP